MRGSEVVWGVVVLGGVRVRGIVHSGDKVGWDEEIEKLGGADSRMKTLKAVCRVWSDAQYN